MSRAAHRSLPAVAAGGIDSTSNPTVAAPCSRAQRSHPRARAVVDEIPIEHSIPSPHERPPYKKTATTMAWSPQSLRNPRRDAQYDGGEGLEKPRTELNCSFFVESRRAAAPCSCGLRREWVAPQSEIHPAAECGSSEAEGALRLKLPRLTQIRTKLQLSAGGLPS